MTDNKSPINPGNTGEFTFPIIKIGKRNEITIIAKTTNDYSVVTCVDGHIFVALKDHPVNKERQYQCPHCLLRAYNDLISEDAIWS